MITNYKINQPFTSDLSVEEGEKIPVALEIMEPAELSTMFKPFLTQKPEKSVGGKLYSRNTVNTNSFRAGQIFSGSLQRKPFSIIRDKVFKPANEALNPSLKDDLARQGLISFTKAQASNFQRRPWSAWSECSRKFCKFGIV